MTNARNISAGVFLTALIAAPIILGAFLLPRPAQAQGGLLGCSGGSAIGTGVAAAAAAAGAMVPTFDPSNFTVNAAVASKECVLDGLVTLIREVMVAQITRSIVNWINNGFKGNPAFVTDLGGFFGDVADQVIGEYIYGSQLAFLCSPFQARIRIALAFSYQERRRVSCTLSQVVGNIDNFLKGNFLSGGYPGLLSIATQPSNTALGAFLQADAAIQGGIAGQQTIASKKLEYGSGFLSYEVCDNPGSDELEDGNWSAPSGCRIETPGSVLNNTLNRTLESSIGRLELADEIDEIIGALAGQLLQQVLGGGGLSGLSSSGGDTYGGGGGTYLDGLVSETTSSQFAGTYNAALQAVDELISSEQLFRNGNIDGAKLAETNRNIVADTRSCYLNKFKDELQLTSTQQAFQATAAQRAQQASTTIQTTIEPEIASYNTAVASSTQNINTLLDIRSRIANTNTIEEINTINTEIQAIQKTTTFHNSISILTTNAKVESTRRALDAYNSELNACKIFGTQ